MAILADGSSYLDRYVEGVIEAEGFAASCRLQFLHLMLSGPGGSRDHLECAVGLAA
jgi:hypothetical protein